MKLLDSCVFSSSLRILSNIPSGINRRGCECVVKCFLVFDLVSYIFLLEVKMSLSFEDVVVFDFTDLVVSSSQVLCVEKMSTYSIQFMLK